MKYLTTAQFAAAVGLSHGRIVQLIASGRIKAILPSKSIYLIEPGELERFKATPRRVGRPKVNP